MKILRIMKKYCKLLSILLFFSTYCLAYSNVIGPIVKQKSIKKIYFVYPNVDVVINNTYGNISVATWDEDKVELEILIKVLGQNEKWIDQKLDDITINIEALKAKITATTSIGNSINSSKNQNNSFEIHYQLKIPKNGNLTILNKYGNIYLGEINGFTNISCQYGKILIDRLSNDKNNIYLEYCENSKIKYIKKANISSKYSELDIDTALSLTVDSNYTQLQIDQIGSLQLHTKYGNVSIKNIKNFVSRSTYTDIDILQIVEQAIINTKYGHVKIQNMEVNNLININGSYTQIEIGFKPSYAFDFNISLKYADLKAPNDLFFNTKSESAVHSNYLGYYKTRGLHQITLQSDYGSIKLTKNKL
ncbi:hypothetical protein B0A77_02885 [Flavobacterium branchiophilum]|uniref:Uncharacterized protein n=2 Tax=Flavobacterium branchiophilum TaxID=55197 RepID=A0A2H3KTX6_9FLAO|nr:hypothetical protein B0A77_02885 [Flavobacterium branchiophilum]